ncbi:MAG: hypothetical protein IPO78_10165 [Saprospiraceae bacterium]|nr:hypothetical protein [Saprospiraceae bacterium]
MILKITPSLKFLKARIVEIEEICQMYPIDNVIAIDAQQLLDIMLKLENLKEQGKSDLDEIWRLSDSFYRINLRVMTKFDLLKIKKRYSSFSASNKTEKLAFDYMNQSIDLMIDAIERLDYQALYFLRISVCANLRTFLSITDILE